jgi:GxxExxY protein
MGLVRDAPHEDVTYKIIGACMAVHNDLGPGHREEAYQRALTFKFSQIGLPFEEQVSIEVYNEAGATVQLYVLDYRVEPRIIVEIKAHSPNLTNDDMAQVIDYFAGSDCEVALLVNFGRPRLEWKRLFPPKKILEHRRKKWGRQRM